MFPSTMRAAITLGPHQIRVEHISTPHPPIGEVLVEVDGIGLCGSDVHSFTGERVIPYPSILGHELIGHIVATGKGVKSGRVGERVVIEPNIPCEHCALCLRGLGRICTKKQSIGLTRPGGMAEYVTVPADFAWVISETLSPQIAVMIEPTAVAYHAFAHAEAPSQSTIGIIGLGNIGQLIAQIALASGNRVVAIEPNLVRQQAALQRGVDGVLGVADAETTRTFFATHQVSAVFECAGVQATTQLCLDAAIPGMRVILVGLANSIVSFNPLTFVRSEIEVRSSIIYDHPHDFAHTIEFIQSGRLKLDQATTNPHSLDDLSTLLESMHAGTISAKPFVLPRLYGSGECK